jgi:hypothetical protein
MQDTIKVPAVAYYRMSSDKQECSIEDQRTAVVIRLAAHGRVPAELGAHRR